LQLRACDDNKLKEKKMNENHFYLGDEATKSNLKEKGDVLTW
jgi:hypothetical protein